MIVRKWNGSSASFKQDEIVEVIIEKMGGKFKSREELFGNHWLDVEPLYIRAGWFVKFDKPSYFEFSKRKKASGGYWV